MSLDTYYYRDRKRENKEKLVKLFNNICHDCQGTFHSCVYHFDHKDVNTKNANISSLLLRDWSLIEAEVKKCEMVCANCHAIRTLNNKEISIKIRQKIQNKKSKVPPGTLL